MTSSHIQPRLDQISELSRGIQLPLAALHPIHLQMIADRFIRAYQEIKLDHASTIATGTEAEVSSLMQARLNSFIDSDIIWRQLVACVSRGTESLSFDGAHLEKRPDLSIYLTDRSRNFPLIAEAKIIDGPNGKTDNLYCKEGLQRFVVGEYGWGTGEAYMLAYVRDNTNFSDKVKPRLEQDQGQTPSLYRTQTISHPTGSVKANTTHTRAFTYTHQTAPHHQPGPLDLWHIWLS